jgi:hypothetical protein
MPNNADGHTFQCCEIGATPSFSFVCAEGFIQQAFISNPTYIYGRLCDLAGRVSAYRSRGSGSIPSATRFSEK